MALGLVGVLYIAACILPSLGEKWPKTAPGCVFLIVGVPLFFICCSFHIWTLAWWLRRHGKARTTNPLALLLRSLLGVGSVFLSVVGAIMLMSVAQNKTISGGAGFLIVPAWLANPLLLLGVLLLRRGRNDWAFIAGVGASACSLLWLEGLILRDEPIFSGYVCWQASILVFTLAAFIILKTYGKRTD